MTDTSESGLAYDPQVVADPATAAAVARSGGRLFVWADDAGFERVSATAPLEPRRFDEYPGDGYTLCVDTETSVPPRWIVKRRRLGSGFKVVLDWKAPSEAGGDLLGWILRAIFSRR